jgi:tRNA (guanine-N7-)-methyltransferase
MAAHLKIHPMFDTIPNEELVDDPTEEGKKVERNKGDKWVACFRRREDPPL